MNFDKNSFQIEEKTISGKTIKYRSFRNISYVKYPVSSEFQQLNIYSPETYFEGGTINGYDINTAPIFLPNSVGGFMPCKQEEPGFDEFEQSKPNTIFQCIEHGYVVVSPALRGRTNIDEKGKYIGKAPNCIIDYKSVVSFIHFFSHDIPGDSEKIISNGTSAGGLLSALLGATGNNSDYSSYKESIGSFCERDDVFAASCYCPIMNFENCDICYEWQFSNVYDYSGNIASIDENGKLQFEKVEGKMTTDQIQISKEISSLFPQYLNSLKLRDKNGNLLLINENGEGTFKDAFKQVLLQSVQVAINEGIDVSDKKWLNVDNKKEVSVDFIEYAKDVKRIKAAPVFDDLKCQGSLNDLFGNETEKVRHFTDYSMKKGLESFSKADEGIIKMMNPMNYLDHSISTKSKHWRIRHGSKDGHISLAISLIFSIMLENNGYCVDFFSPFDISHSGDYDIDNLFMWIDSII